MKRLSQNKPLRIAQVAPLWYKVPPDGYGGTELIVSRLTEEFVRRGHEVTLFASGDSKTKGKLFSIVEKNLFDLNVPWLYGSQNMVNLLEAFERDKQFDIVHTHIDVFDPVIRGHHQHVPSVATLHNPFWPMPNDPKKNKRWHAFNGRVMLYNKFHRLPYVAISDNYRKQCPANINFAKTIYHGVNIEELKFNPKGGDYFVWLGRISSAKGVHIAAQIANKMGLKLKIAGKIVNPEANGFFKKMVKPYLNKDVKFIGEIKTANEKSEFFGNARGFLYPLQWEEPFGITMIESQACGTPVIAFRRGSVPEIIRHNETGFIVDTLPEFKKALKNIDTIDRKKCRDWVEQKFTIEKMAEQYEELYYDIIKQWPEKIKK